MLYHHKIHARAHLLAVVHINLSLESRLSTILLQHTGYVCSGATPSFSSFQTHTPGYRVDSGCPGQAGPCHVTVQVTPKGINCFAICVYVCPGSKVPQAGLVGDMRISYAKFLQLLRGNRIKRLIIYGDLRTAIVEVSHRKQGATTCSF